MTPRMRTIAGMPAASAPALNRPEPPPTHNEHRAVWDEFFRRFGAQVDLLVADDIVVRDEMGEAKYGVRLRPFNGRDPEVDLYQELLDAIVYAMQALVEAEEEKRARPRHHGRVCRLIVLANETRACMQGR